VKRKPAPGGGHSGGGKGVLPYGEERRPNLELHARGRQDGSQKKGKKYVGAIDQGLSPRAGDRNNRVAGQKKEPFLLRMTIQKKEKRETRQKKERKKGGGGYDAAPEMLSMRKSSTSKGGPGGNTRPALRKQTMSGFVFRGKRAKAELVAGCGKSRAFEKTKRLTRRPPKGGRISFPRSRKEESTRGDDGEKKKTGRAQGHVCLARKQEKGSPNAHKRATFLELVHKGGKGVCSKSQMEARSPNLDGATKRTP